MALMYYIVPLFVALVFLFSLRKNSYDNFIVGAGKGIETSLKIFPYLLAMIFATKLLDASLFLFYLFKNTDLPYLFFIEGVFRPFSNNASLSILLQIYQNYGVDSKISIVSSILQGGTETSFYILTVYFGAVDVKHFHYSIVLALLSDLLIFCFCLLLYYYIL